MSERSAHEQPSRSRVGIVVCLLVSLLASAGTRYWADQKRAVDIPNHGENGAGTSLSSMNSFALGLLLGGLRGPLVMVLWTNSETQKSSKDLEGVDTQIEWIRLLQPEFDTVHIFEIWNKAYNISVQMASLANKYSVILDALDYAKSVDREKPEDINILTAIAQIYFDKLGSSTEKFYYKKRVRQESLPHRNNNGLRRQDIGWRRTQLDAMLDDQFNILPSLSTPVPGRHTPADPKEEYNDGSDLQYLVKFQPYPTGLSPFALAYNYDKRSEVLMNVGKQRHAQLSDLVIDSRPALALKNWAEDSWEEAMRLELQTFGVPAVDERTQMELLTANLPLDRPVIDRHSAELALVEDARVSRLVDEAIAEYIRHLSHDTTNEGNYRSHMDELMGDGQMAQADHDYLAAMLTSSTSERAPLMQSAGLHYLQATYYFELLLLKYYTDPRLLTDALPPGFARNHTADHKGIEELSPQQADAVMAMTMRAMSKLPDSHAEDQKDYLPSLARAGARLSQLRGPATTQPGPTTSP